MREESFCRFMLAFLLLLRRPALPLLLVDGRIGVLSCRGDLHESDVQIMHSCSMQQYSYSLLITYLPIRLTTEWLRQSACFAFLFRTHNVVLATAFTFNNFRNDTLLHW